MQSRHTISVINFSCVHAVEQTQVVMKLSLLSIGVAKKIQTFMAPEYY